MAHHVRILFFLFLFANCTFAQVYPVQGSATLVPPYALRLSDYATSTSERIVLNTLLADITKAELHVRLKISITGQNVKLETKPEYIGSPITLQGGVPLRLTNVELAEYFDANHLNFSGISKSEFFKTGFLPEGFYQFCFEVYEYGRGVKISSTICAPAWLILNDPPIVNLPRNGEKLKPLNPQNVIFQWTPRHTGSPNAAFTTEYDIKVVEVWPFNRNPNDAILSQPTIYETTTHSTTLIYGPDATQLEPGRTYAFRVQARAMASAEQLDLFKNNGFSETVTFVYGDACDAPINIVADAAASRITLHWDASPSQTGYTVKYRQKISLGEWYSTQSLIPDAQLNDLQPNTTYEYQVMSTCGFFESNYGDVASITTPAIPQRAYACGTPIENFNLDPSQLIPVLKVGDVLKAADFDVTTTKVSGANGVFSGEGTVAVPFFNNASARVKFDGITVSRDANSEKRMVRGQMTVVGPALVPHSVLNGVDQLSQAISAADSAINNARQFLTPKPDPDDFVADQVVSVPSGVNNAYYDVATGKVIVVDNNGKQQSLTADKNYAITDGTGAGVIVAKNGGITKVTAPEMGKVLDRKYDPSLSFANTADSRYGIDIQKVDALKKNYEELVADYFVSFKAVAVGTTEPVAATLIKTSVDLGKIKFDQDNNAVSATVKDGSITLYATAKATGDNPPIFARTTDATAKKETVVGKLNVTGYNPENLKLHIIPVNGTTVPTTAADIEKQLNIIYSQAIVSWTVAMDANLKVEGLATPFDNGSSGALSTYTGDMKTVIKTFLNNTKLENDNYYLFLVPQGTNTDETGYMPRSKQCGFIFGPEPSEGPPTPGTQSPTPNTQLLRTIAHELGHGAFTLEHTFADYPALPQGTTDNLMDYSAGTTLWKYQWDIAHKPRVVLGLFEGDEAGASKKIGGNYTVYVGDSVMKSKKIFVNGTNASLFVKYQPAANDTSTFINTKAIYRAEDSKTEISTPNLNWKRININVKTRLELDSLPEGRYSILFKDKNGKVDTMIFYLRKNKYDFACKVCGRDLTVTLDKLTKMSMRPSINMSNEDAKLLTTLLKQAGFNSCKAQAHFFSQSCHETNGFTKFAEFTSFSINAFFSGGIFSNNCNAKILYSQSFWDNKTYKSYFSLGPLYEVSTNSSAPSKFIPPKESQKKYKWNPAKASSDFTSCSNAVVQVGDTIKYPTAFNSATTVSTNTTFYEKYTLSSDQKEACNKKLYSLLYATFLENGQPETNDGYNFRGRGFVHLTGKKNYKDVADKCNETFSTNFDFVTEYNKLTTDMNYVIYSAVAYYLQKNAVASLHTRNCLDVTKIVNGGKNGYDDTEHSLYTRLSLFKKYKDEIFYSCNVSENK